MTNHRIGAICRQALDLGPVSQSIPRPWPQSRARPALSGADVVRDSNCHLVQIPVLKPGQIHAAPNLKAMLKNPGC